jgi:hypothetical protein
MKQKYLILLLVLMPSIVFSADLRGRMGVGMTNQLANGLPAISVKVQQSKTFAMGGLLGFQSDQDQTLYGAGIKLYRIIFDEPQLNFYLAGLFATETYLNDEAKVDSGFQIDGTMGTEFHFTGIESLGFSLEFGVSARKADSNGGTSLETLGDSFLKAAVHFYL